MNSQSKVLRFLLIIGCVLLVILAGQLAVRRYLGATPRQKQAEIRFTEGTLQAISEAIRLYAVENSVLPGALHDLRSKPDRVNLPNWHGPYLTGPLLDYWGHTILYTPEEGSYVLKSLGPDGMAGPDDLLLVGEVPGPREGGH